MADTPETPNIDREQFRQDTGVEVPIDKWQPLKPDAREKLAALKNEIATTREADKKLEKALAFIEANKAPAAVVAWAGALEANEVRAELQNVIGDVGAEVKKAIGPWALMFTDVSKAKAEDIAGSVKELLAKKEALKDASLFSDPWGWIQKIFFWLTLKITGSRLQKAGMDISKFLSPEELAQSGLLTVPNGAPNESTEQEKKLSKKYILSRKVFSGLFLDAKLPTENILDNITMKGSSLQELKGVHSRKDYSNFLMKIGMESNEDNKKALSQILIVLFEGKRSHYICEAYNGWMRIDKSTPIPDTVSFADYLIGAGWVLRRMKWVAQAAISHELPSPSMKYNHEKQEMEFEESYDGESFLDLVGGDKKMLAFTLGTSNKLKYGIGKSQSFLSELEWNATFSQLYAEKAQKEQALWTMKKVLEFWDSFMQTIRSNEQIHLGMKPELDRIVWGKKMNLRAMMLLYLSFEGKDIQNFTQLSTIEQGQVYGMVLSLFRDDDSFTNGNNTAKYLWALNDSKLEIPQKVKEMMSETAIAATKKAAGWLWEWTKYIAGVAWDNPKLAISYLLLNLPFIPERNSVQGVIFGD